MTSAHARARTFVSLPMGPSIPHNTTQKNAGTDTETKRKRGERG